MFWGYEDLIVLILNLSFAGSVAIAFVLAFRLLLGKAPKIFSYALWSVVLFRLLCPFSFESEASILPTNPAPIPMDIAMQVQPKGETILPPLNSAAVNIDPSTPEVPQAAVVKANPVQMWLGLGEIVWWFGLLGLFSYSILSLIRLRKRLVGALPLEQGVYLTENIQTPFVMGLFFPKIYLPLGLSMREQGYILLHERTHIRRGDHVIKLVAFFTLCLHWFNPLVWLAFFLMSKDMEMSCDESVIRKLGNEVKQDYSSSLLSLATGRTILGGTPLAFGEGDTKSRIRHVLNYKRPAFWLSAVGLLLVVVACVTLALNPPGEAEQEFPANMYLVDEVCYTPVYSSTIYTPETAPAYTISGERLLLRYTRENKDAASLGTLHEISLSRAERRALLPIVVDADKEIVDRLARVQTIYRVDAEDSSSLGSGGFALVMQEKDGTVLIGEGGKNQEGKDAIGVLFQVTPQIDLNAAERLHQYRTPYVGDNSAVGNLITTLRLPEELGYTGFSIKDKSLNLRFQAEQYPEGGIERFYQRLLQKDAFILFALIENVKYVNFSWGENFSAGGIGVTEDLAESTLGYDHFKQGETVEGVSHILREIVGLLPDHSEDESKRYTQLQQTMTNAILETRRSTVEGEITAEGHEILSSESGKRTGEDGREVDILRVYAYCIVYDFLPQESGFERISGGAEFAIFGFDVSDKGVYSCTDYRYGEEVKADMSDWARSERLPEGFVEALGERRHENALRTCFEQAVIEGGVNSDLAIERLLVLALGHDDSAAKDARWQLEGYGEMTLQYCYREFLKGSQNGPRADLMSDLCQSITKANRDTWVDSWGPDASLRGQAWFDAFRVSMEQAIEKDGLETVRSLRVDAKNLLAILSE